VFAADAEALLRLADAGFDPRRQVVLPAELEAGLGDLPFEAAELTNVEVGRHRVVFDVESFGPALAVVAQAHYPAWKVYIDGQTADLFRANVAFQAVLVPPGQHHVEILYVDTKFRFGLMISGFSLVVCLLGLARKKAAPAKGDGRLKSMI
jgi:hypothetical protein